MRGSAGAGGSARAVGAKAAHSSAAPTDSFTATEADKRIDSVLELGL